MKQNDADLLQSTRFSTPGFVGRVSVIESFESCLHKVPDNEGYKYVFSLHGPGGIGKTWLLRKFQTIASEEGWIVCGVDESAEDIPQTLNNFSEMLKAQGISLKKFQRRYKDYLKRKSEIENSPNKPDGIAAFIGRTVAKGGIQLGKQVPFAGNVLSLIDEDEIVAQFGEWTNYVSKVIRNKEDIELLLKPVEILTKLFLDELRNGIGGRNVLFCFDTYEHNNHWDKWIRDILNSAFGRLDFKHFVLISGRNGLVINDWRNFWKNVVDISIEPFNKTEVLEYLRAQNITDENITNAILDKSQGFPYLVQMLSLPGGAENFFVDQNETAVELFLKWIEDPKRRFLSTTSAVPRYVNQDVIFTILGEKDQALYRWLTREASLLILRHEGKYTYHTEVRKIMNRYMRNISPLEWSETHGKLAEYYQKLLTHFTEAGQPIDFQQENISEFYFESIYHHLCNSPLPHIALNQFFKLLSSGVEFRLLEKCAQTIVQVGLDADETRISYLGETLIGCITAFTKGDHQATYKILTDLINHARTLSVEKSVILWLLVWRGNTLMKLREYPQAINDLTFVINDDLNNFTALTYRAEAYYHNSNFPEALIDVNNALRESPGSDTLYTLQGQIRLSLGDEKKALESAMQALKINPENINAVGVLGEAYLVMGNLTDAVGAFNRVLEYSPDAIWYLSRRGVAYMLMGEQEKAIVDFNKATESFPCGVVTLFRSQLDVELLQYRQKFKNTHALNEILNDNSNPRLTQGLQYLRYAGYLQQQGKYEEALASINKAIEVPELRTDVLFMRAFLLLRIAHIVEALADLDELISVYPDYMQAFILKGDAYRLLNEYQKAIESYSRVLDRENSEKEQIQMQRAFCYMQNGDYQSAILDYQAVLSKYNDNQTANFYYFQLLCLLERKEEARLELDQLILHNPQTSLFWGLRGFVFMQLGDPVKAVPDFTKAIELGAKIDWFYKQRADAYTTVGKYNDALADFQKAVELAPDNTVYRLDVIKGLINDNQFSQALDELKLVGDTDAPIYHEYMAIALAGVGEHRQAAEEWALVFENPICHGCANFYDCLMRQGKSYLYAHLDQDAVRAFNQSIEVKADFSLVYYYRLLAYRRLNQETELEDAIRYILEMTKTMGNEYERDAFNGVICLVQNDVENAKHLLSRVDLPECSNDSLMEILVMLKEFLVIFPDNEVASNQVRHIQTYLGL